MEEISTSNICNDDCNDPGYFRAMTTIAERIANARKDMNLNQSELARALSVTPQAVQSWESGKARPKGARLENLAKVLGTTAEWLIMGKRPLFAKDMSESVTESAVKKIKEAIARDSATPAEYELKLNKTAEYLYVSHSLDEMHKRMKQVLVEAVDELKLFERLDRPEQMSTMFYVMQAAAEGVISPDEWEYLGAIANRMRHGIPSQAK